MRGPRAQWTGIVRLVLGLAMLGWGLSCAASGSSGGEGSCPVGSETCECTRGGACDPGLECLSGVCVDPDSGSGGGGSDAGGGGSGGSRSTSTGAGADNSCMDGCQAVDVLFAMDSSASMTEETNALSAAAAFEQVVNQIAAVNCGQIDYRIGLTDDYDAGFVVGDQFAGPNPWFDSQEMAQAQIVSEFAKAATKLSQQQSTPAGCEHVLTSATHLLESDETGFVREGALLVLVLLTDVDDYGAYDQQDGNSCNLGCTESVPTLQSLYDGLVGVKGGDPNAVAAIVIAGDPNVNAGLNLCDQPGSCGCGSVDCSVFHATRLWQFAGMLEGTNGVTNDLCAGASSVPTFVEDAFASDIDLACQELEKPK